MIFTSEYFPLLQLVVILASTMFCKLSNSRSISIRDAYRPTVLSEYFTTYERERFPASKIFLWTRSERFSVRFKFGNQGGLGIELYWITFLQTSNFSFGWVVLWINDLQTVFFYTRSSFCTHCLRCACTNGFTLTNFLHWPALFRQWSVLQIPIVSLVFTFLV